MASVPDTTVNPSLLASTWKTPVLVGGLCFLLVWRSISFVDSDWLTVIPSWLLLAIAGIIPQLFLLIYPLVTRQQASATRFRLPRLKRLAIEAVIALPIIVGCVLLLTIVQYALARLSPGTSLYPEFMERMGRSPGTPFVYAFLLASFLYGPIAEEVFFRGFLFNAFRKRMPLVAAVVVQSLIFGFAHFYGSSHAFAVAFLGLVLTLVYWWRQTIFAPIFVHAGFNALAVAGVLLTMYAHSNSAFLGVSPQEPVTENVIGTVTPNSPAAESGLRPGDTITHFDTHPVTDFQNLAETVSWYEPGDSVVVTVVRDGMPIDITVILTSRRAMSTQ